MLVLVVVVLMHVEVCLVVVEDRSLLGDVCMSVFYGVSLVSTYIRRLCYAVYDFPIFVHLERYLVSNKFCRSKKIKINK